MRVLVLGATGNLGARLLSALIQQGHVAVAFVRNPSKLAPDIRAHLEAVEEGDARIASQIKQAATANRCDAIVNTAGYAAMVPWGKSDLPIIVDAVIHAAVELGHERGSPLRVWFLGGQGILDTPSRKSMIVDYMHLFPEHRTTWEKLLALPRSSITWSLLCPGMMYPLSTTSFPIPSAASARNLSAEAGVPPGWSSMFLCMPLIGGYLNIMSQIGGYSVGLEDCADFIAQDLLLGESSQWVYEKVGVRRV